MLYLLLFIPAVASANVAPPRSFFELDRAEKPPTIVRVMIGKFSQISLSGIDLKINGGSSLAGESNMLIRCGTEKSGASYVDLGTRRVYASNAEIESPSGFVRMNGKAYREKITLIAKKSTCMAVNSLNLEKYLAGVLNKEMVPSWPIEALKAQAVAARSYALYQMHENRWKEYDLEGSVQDQVYEGSDSETPKSSQAVEQTSGLTIEYGSEVLKAFFHSNCGGKTEVPENVWGKQKAAYKAVTCPYHKKEKDQRRWSIYFSRAQMEHALKKVAGLIPNNFIRLAKVEIGSTNESKRRTDVVLSDGSGNNLVLPAHQFRMAMGNTKVKSTAFHIHSQQGGVEISGEGYGHGVGMCQTGAKVMAEQGKTFMEILRYYYPLAKIVRHN